MITEGKPQPEAQLNLSKRECDNYHIKFSNYHKAVIKMKNEFMLEMQRLDEELILLDSKIQAASEKTFKK